MGDEIVGDQRRPGQLGRAAVQPDARAGRFERLAARAPASPR